MSPEIIGILGLVALLVLLALKMWVGAVMLLVSIVGIIVLKSPTAALTAAGTSAFSNLNTYVFTVVPMFTFMGMVIAESTLGLSLYEAAAAWVGRFRGGLASSTIIACGVLGAISGSSLVGVLVMSRVALPEMKRHKYDESFAAGAVAAGSPLSILIPPSVGFIMYGIITENNIGKLFMSGLGVGILQMVMYIGVIAILCRRKPHYGPGGPSFPLKHMLKALVKIVPMLLLVVLVLGGIYMGFFTTTEAGAVGAFGSIVISFAFRQLTVRKLVRALEDTAVLCGMIFFLIASTYLFVTFMGLSRLPMALANLVVDLSVPNWVLALALLVLYFILGMFLPEIPMVVLTLPVLYTALISSGFDPIWLGAFIVKLMALGSVSPPVGMIVYAMSGVTGMKVQKIFKGVMPYLAADVVIVVLLIVFPQIATFIPSHM